MPGGLEGVANLTAQLHIHGVKMLWPNKPWDLGTRYEPAGRPGLSDTDAKVYATLLKLTDGDGLNRDTMDSFSKEFYAESARLGHSIALEPENGVEDEALDWSTINWGYWSYPKAPVVDRFKFVTDGRFLTNVYNRWAKDKTNGLQSACFNGDGYESWENVWGVWNGITHYDGEAICRVGTMLRYFGKEGFLASPDWEPYAREVWQADVYSSKFPLKERGQSVWAIVNMRELTARHLASYDHTWKYLPQTLVEIPLTALATEAPAGTVLVPREESFLFEVSGVEIKGDDEHGVDAQYPWEEHPQRSHSQILAVGPFYLDKFPVTAANYSVYLEATGYEPAKAYNWLKNWDGPRRNRGPACDLHQHRRGARLLRLEGRAPATLLGVAVRSLGHRRAPLSLGR